jgi:hypothetical protein
VPLQQEGAQVQSSRHGGEGSSSDPCENSARYV